MEMWPATTRSGDALKRLIYLSSRRPSAPRTLHSVPTFPQGTVESSERREDPPVPQNASRDTTAATDPLLEIAAAARTGDQRAVRSLVTKMRASTAQIVRNVLGPSHPALDDVIQEATIAQVNSLRNFRGESSIAHFVNSVTLRVALCSRRRINSRRERMDGVRWELPPDVDPHTPLSIAMDKRSRDSILRILRELPSNNVEVLILHTIFGYSTAELAQMRQVTEGTIRSQMRTAKKEFRRLMRRERRTGRAV